jgi:hypothetical protein
MTRHHSKTRLGYYLSIVFIFTSALTFGEPLTSLSPGGNDKNSWIVNFEQKGDLLVVSQSKTGAPGQKPMTCIVTKVENLKPRTFCGLLQPNENTFVFLQTNGTKLTLRDISSIQETTVIDAAPSDWSVSIGMSAGTNYLFNQLTLEGRITPEITLGLTPMGLSASNSDSKLSAAGALLTSSYYFTSAQSLTGFWAKFGLGYYSISLEDPNASKTTKAWSSILTGGYRARLGKGFTALAGAGLQYIKTFSDTDDRISFNGLRPVITVELGHRF